MCFSVKPSHENGWKEKRNYPKKLDFLYHTFGGSSDISMTSFYTCIVKYLILFNLQTKLIKTIKAIRYCNNSQENKVYIIL